MDTKCRLEIFEEVRMTTLESLVVAGFVANFVCVAYTGIWLKNILLDMARGIEAQLNRIEGRAEN